MAASWGKPIWGAFSRETLPEFLLFIFEVIVYSALLLLALPQVVLQDFELLEVVFGCPIEGLRSVGCKARVASWLLGVVLAQYSLVLGLVEGRVLLLLLLFLVRALCLL